MRKCYRNFDITMDKFLNNRKNSYWRWFIHVKFKSKRKDAIGGSKKS